MPGQDPAAGPPGKRGRSSALISNSWAKGLVLITVGHRNDPVGLHANHPLPMAHSIGVSRTLSKRHAGGQRFVIARGKRAIGHSSAMLNPGCACERHDVPDALAELLEGQSENPIVVSMKHVAEPRIRE